MEAGANGRFDIMRVLLDAGADQDMALLVAARTGLLSW